MRNLIDEIRSMAGIEPPFSSPWSAEAVAAAIDYWRDLGHSEEGILWVIAEVREIQSVIAPRATSARLYSRQFVTR